MSEILYWEFLFGLSMAVLAVYPAEFFNRTIMRILIVAIISIVFFLSVFGLGLIPIEGRGMGRLFAHIIGILIGVRAGMYAHSLRNPS